MKIATKLMLLLAIVAMVVSAAPIGARAQIPFAFQLNGKTFEAGTYRFEATPWNGIVAMEGPTGHKTLLLTTPMGNPYKPADPRLAFVRTKKGMSLSEVWMNTGPGGHKLATPRPAAGESVEIALARL